FSAVPVLRKPSFPRSLSSAKAGERESNAEPVAGAWIPAYAGMTALCMNSTRKSFGFSIPTLLTTRRVYA
ncbi:MAG: hypothetical protein ACRD2O_07430, partial [Terriglobia bacterium]